MHKHYQYGDLSLRKRKKGPAVWQFRYFENGRRKSMLVGTVERFPSKSAEVRAIEHLRMHINTQSPQLGFHHVTVGGLIDRFVKDELPKVRRFQTQAEYRTYFESYIRPQWGNLFLDQVETMAVMDWLESLRGKMTKKPLAPQTKSHIRNAFYLLFQWAWRWKLVDHNPIQLVRQSSKRLKIPRVLKPAQFQALLRKLKDPYRTMVLVAGGTGLRVSEIMGLKWGDVNWQSLEADVRRSVVAGRENAKRPKPQKSSCRLTQQLRRHS